MASEKVDHVFVTTDCEEISAAAKEYYPNIYVIHRPAAISGDDATSESALIHAEEYISCLARKVLSLLVMLPPTSPIRQPDDIDNAIRTIEKTGDDSLYSSRSVHGFVWRGGDQDTLRPLGYNPGKRPRRQDLQEITVEENGSIYITRPAPLYESNCLLSGRIATYPMHPLDSFQIDEPVDVELIESLWKVRMSHAECNAYC